MPEEERRINIDQIINNRLCKGYFTAITYAVDRYGIDAGEEAARAVLKRLPLVSTVEENGVILETRLVGTFDVEPGKRNVNQMAYMEHLSGVIKTILMEDDFIPSINVDPIAGKWTITTKALKPQL
jgi:hypothetical protein